MRVTEEMPYADMVITSDADVHVNHNRVQFKNISFDNCIEIVDCRGNVFVKRPNNYSTNTTILRR